MPNRARRKTPPKPIFIGSQHMKDWQKCYEEWLVSVRERTGAASTISSYRCEMQHFFTDHKKAPDRYTRNDVALFIRKKVRKVTGHIVDPSPYTQNRRLATLKSFYDFASAYQVPFHNGQRPIMSKPSPCNGLKAIKPGRKPRGLTEDELKQFTSVIPRESVVGKRDFALVSAYFWTCGRRNQILALKWGDLYEVVFVEKGKQRIGHMYRYSTKGHSRDVFTAEFPQEAWDALIDYLKASGRYEHMRADSPLFIATIYQAGPEKPLHFTRVNDIIKRYGRLAGLHTNGREITTHWLRHTRAQLQRKYDKSPEALEKIRKLLGHESLNTTFLYLAGIEENPDDGAALLASRIGKL